MKVVFWGVTAPYEVTRNMYMMAELFSVYEPSVKIRIFRKRQDMEQSGGGFRLKQPCFKEDSRYQTAGKELSFYDCGSRLDTGTRRQMGGADLVVVNLPQNRRAWEHFGIFNLCRKEKMLFLMTDYFEGNSVNREMIETKYRIDAEKIAVIPYNNEFYYAAEQGKITDFLHRNVWRSEKNKMWKSELEQTLFRFGRELRMK